MPAAPAVTRCRVLLAACALVGACAGADADGFEIEVALSAPSGGQSMDASGLRIRNDRGYVVELDRGYLATTSVEIVGCPAGARSAAARARWPELRRLWSWEGTAQAHERATPTRLGTPVVQPLTGASEQPMVLGTLRPPPASYCRVRVGLGPADADAHALPEGIGFVGKTFLLTGQLHPTDGGAPRPFTIASSAALTSELALAPLVLADGATRRHTLVVGMSATHWFDGIDFAELASDEIARRLLEGMRASLTVVAP